MGTIFGTRSRTDQVGDLGQGVRVREAGRRLADAARGVGPSAQMDLSAIGGARAVPPPIAPVRPPIGRAERWHGVPAGRPDLGTSAPPERPMPNHASVESAMSRGPRPWAAAAARLPPSLGEALRVLAEPAQRAHVSATDVLLVQQGEPSLSRVQEVPLVRVGEAQRAMADVPMPAPTNTERSAAQPRWHPSSSETPLVPGHEEETGISMTATSMLRELMDEDDRV